MTEAKEGTEVLGDDALRLVDVLLEESFRSSRSAVRPPPAQTGKLWLGAAVVLLGIGVLLGVSALKGSAATQLQDPTPAPAPAPAPVLPPVSEDVMRALRRIHEIGDAPSRTHETGVFADWSLDSAAQPKIESRLPRLPEPAAGGVVVNFHQKRDSAPGTVSPAVDLPALALVRDMLPPASGASSSLHADVTNAQDLAQLPGYLLSMYCRDGDVALLAAELPRFTSLQALKLGSLLDDRVAAGLANASQLTQLEAGCIGLTDDGLLSLSRLRSLRRLVLWGNVAALEGQALVAMRQLECLQLAAPLEPFDAHTSARGELLQNALHLPKLRELQIVLTRAPDDQPDGQSPLLRPLQLLPALRRLGVVAITGSLSSLVRGLPSLQLERLRIGTAGLQPADVEALASMSNLCELDLSDARFASPAAAVTAFAKMANLRRLVLGFTNMTVDQQDQLLSALPDCIVFTDTVTGPPGGPNQALRSGRSSRGDKNR